MRFKLLSLFAALFLVAACETATEETTDTSTTSSTTPTTTTTTTSQPATIETSDQEDLLINVGDRIFFDYDKSSLKPESQDTLQKLASWMGDRPNVTITVEGHADERGTREYNLALGERRANAVSDYLVALGVSQGRVLTISYGKERPAVLGSSEGAWAQNRRGVFVVN